MKEQVFRYYKGKENIVVVEQDNFEESLFREQYVQALQQVTDLIEHPKDDAPNLIAFCGDRGEGKTSCMVTVNHIVVNLRNEKISKEIEALGITINKIMDAEFTTIPIIDPAFFDKEHNIIELLLGHLYKNFKDWGNKPENQGRYGETNEVAKQFQKAKTCLMHIEQAKVAMYDPLEELEVLSAGVELSNCVSKLIEKYLSLIGKKRLLICIDDIDLNMSRAYRMCEEIRKYLNNKHCLIFMSVKIDQLIEAIENDIHKEADYPNELDFSGMASKYVDKLIPVSIRVNMPQAYDLCDYRLEVYEDNKNDTKPVYFSQSVKNGVVRKIFATSRFLFYNSKGSVSPIVPNNLRSLTQLLSLLFSMMEIDKVGKNEATGVLEKNKHLFKAYFYKTWVKQLDVSNQKFVNGLTTRQDGSDLNKYVVSYLAGQLKKMELDNNMIKDIIDSANFSYNISVGDVLYLVSYLEQSSFEEEVKNVLFFIKSFYSIRLFEKYDLITNNMGTELYQEKKETGNLYRADVWFEHTNALQRAVAGSYFTYMPNDLISPEKNTSHQRDFKVINGKDGLNVLLSSVLKILKRGKRDSLTPEEVNAFDLRFRMAEFFILAISRSVLQRDIPALSIHPTNRKIANPYYLSSFNKNTGYYVFDILTPFYSLTNPQYTYERFKEIADIWSYAENNEWSLLRQMMSEVRKKEMKENDIPLEQKSYLPIEDNLEYWKRRLLSNAVIRNAEVALAVMENSRNNRSFNRSSSKSRVLISDFYKYITNTEMMTYNQGENEKPYYINFDFLEPIVSLLKDTRIDEALCIEVDGNKLSLPTFEQIYNYVGDVKMAGKTSMAADIFADSFKRFKPTSGLRIIDRIKRNQNNLYNKVPKTEWQKWFEKDIQYTKEEAFSILQFHILDFIMEIMPDSDEE